MLRLFTKFSPVSSDNICMLHAKICIVHAIMYHKSIVYVHVSQGKGTMHYGLVIVGHSLGAGTAAILSFLLRPQYPSLHCYSYSPPGGLLRSVRPCYCCSGICFALHL